MGIQQHWSITPDSNDVADSTLNWREGQAPSTVNNSARGMMAQVAKWRKDTSGELVTGGSSTAYTITTNEGFTALANGMRVVARVHATNGATPTLNVDGLGGGQPIRLAADGAISIGAGTLVINRCYAFTYHSSSGGWVVDSIPETALVSASETVQGIVELATAAETVAMTDNTRAVHPLGLAGLVKKAVSSPTIDTTALVGDHTKTFHLSGATPRTLAFSAAATLGSGWWCYVHNAGTAAWAINPDGAETIDGVSNFYLYPGQGLVVTTDGASFKTVGRPTRWRTSTFELYVNPSLGNDGNDGLAAGSGRAFATQQFAVTFALRFMDVSGTQPPRINLATGTYLEAGVQVVFDGVGANQVSILGDNSTPTNCIIRPGTGDACYYAKDKGILTLSGVYCSPSVATIIGIAAEQIAVIDANVLIFDGSTSAVYMRAEGHARINQGGNWQFQGSGVAAMEATFHGQITIQNFSITFSGSPAFTYVVLGSQGGAIKLAASFVGFVGALTAGAQQYLIQINATLVLNGHTIPGSVAGATAFGGQAV